MAADSPIPCTRITVTIPIANPLASTQNKAVSIKFAKIQKMCYLRLGY